MDKQNDNSESILMDYLLGHCDEQTADDVRKRLAEDPEFSRMKDELARPLACLDAIADVRTPTALFERTMARINAQKKAQAASNKKELRQRIGYPTFTLRELGVAVAAVLLISITAVSYMQQAERKAMANQCAANNGQIGTAMGAYAAANNHQLPADPQASGYWLGGTNRKVSSNSGNLFKLVTNGYALPDTFKCPADPQANQKPLKVDNKMTDFPGPEAISYSYQHTLGPRGMPLRILENASERLAQMVVLSDKTPLFPDGRFNESQLGRTSSDNHGQRGHNVLHLDRHVAWQKSANVGIGNDNIYQIQNVTAYDGSEAPTSATDTFLLPAYSPPTAR